MGGEKIPFSKGKYSYGGRGQNLFVKCSIFNFVFLFPLNLYHFLRPYTMKKNRFNPKTIPTWFLVPRSVKTTLFIL